MIKVFKKQNSKNFELIEGDITKSLPKYIKKPSFKDISFKYRHRFCRKYFLCFRIPISKSFKRWDYFT